MNMVVVANLGKCVGAGTCSCAQIGTHLCFLFLFYVAPRWQSTLPEARAELERLGFLLPSSEESVESDYNGEGHAIGLLLSVSH